MSTALSALPVDQIRLLPGLFQDRFHLNRRYVMSLDSHSLLQNFLLEAGLWQARLRETKRNRAYDPGQQAIEDHMHWGWESPCCELRGHFLGHWLSAAAKIYAGGGDSEVKSKADAIISELARCQEANGGEWVFSIPPVYLDRIARGRAVWAPHYTIHKTLMGLVDMHRYAGSAQALEILAKAASWFHRWTAQFSMEAMDDILDVETGAMLEAWVDLYGFTGEKEHHELVERYTRRRLFDPLVGGKDVLTNRHANTTIPEMHGAARAYEVTGEEKWRSIVEAYWRLAVTERGSFCTGSQTCGELWTPPFHLASRRGDTNQEHCVVYNMIRLADFLLRWTGEAQYGDYIERNLYNGILAQQHPNTGMIAYFLPLEPGAHKVWGSPTHDFWCCHGSLVQAHGSHSAWTAYQSPEGLTLSQYIPTCIQTKQNGVPITVTLSSTLDQTRDHIKDAYEIAPADWHRPERWEFEIAVETQKPVEMSLRLRIPEWVCGEATVMVNDQREKAKIDSSGFLVLRRTWKNERVRLSLPKALTTCPLPDEPDTVAFMDGPVVLAGLCDEERTLKGNAKDPASLLVADNEKEWWRWMPAYRTVGQDRGIRFVPLYHVVDEPYTVYFPTRKA